MMDCFLLACAVLLCGGAGAALLRAFPAASAGLGAGSAVLGALLGLASAIECLRLNGSYERSFPWDMPFGSLTIGMDGLSAFFCLVIFGLAALTAVYGFGYLRRERGRTGLAWCWFNVLVLGMALVAVARNGLLFLIAWEVMSLSSFFLVAHEAEKPEVRKAAWTYLVATHIGAAFVLAMFVLLGTAAGSLDFEDMASLKGAGREFAALIFALAVIGFGTKAGFFPLHVWLPEAHPAAPSHVSALLSGAMIKTGLYALLRCLSFVGPPEPWWGWLLIGIGIVSGLFGVVSALAQHDLKRLLAYHSVENIGIAALGLGLGLLGWSAGNWTLAALGFAGALLHVLNHAVFKGLLFLCAGSVLHATGTRAIERLGGLSARMPVTAFTFFVGAAAICGLPPLNGFASEFLIYLGAFKGVMLADAGIAVPAAALVAALALIGGLAAACFAKAFGVVFLGEGRSEDAARAREGPLAMRGPMLALAAACVAIGLGAFALMPFLAPAVGIITGTPAELFAQPLAEAGRLLLVIALASAALILATALAALLRARLLRGRAVTRAATWDCGYAAPTARMQYTGSSFAQPLLDLFRPFLRVRTELRPPEGLFPKKASFATHADDAARERIFAPIFAFVDSLFSRLRWVQEGRVHVYVLYIALTLLALLVFAL
ncbi:MAG TPA: oxidoreductase [Planctomycetes bacterium]|nr:oxidoreductase [Planctomycetota bacterium]